VEGATTDDAQYQHLPRKASTYICTSCYSRLLVPLYGVKVLSGTTHVGVVGQAVVTNWYFYFSRALAPAYAIMGVTVVLTVPFEISFSTSRPTFAGTGRGPCCCWRVRYAVRWDIRSFPTIITCTYCWSRARRCLAAYTTAAVASVRGANYARRVRSASGHDHMWIQVLDP
jgi:hypothetical protein